MAVDFTPTLDGYTGQSKLRFWCQKVLPLVYDDSLSYYELLNKIVVYLNNTIEDVSACEDNIVALRDAFVELQDYVNEVLDDFAPEVERVIDEMIDSGEFGEILSGVINGLIANEYDPTEAYVQFAYCLKDGKLYCATASTTGEWDETKWRETTIGNDLQLISRRLYSLNAGQVSYDNTATYDNGTVGKKLKDLDYFNTNLNAGQVEYDSEENYDNDTVGKKLQDLNNTLNTEITTRQNIDTSLENAIAYVESSTIASKSYKKGDYLFLTTNNRLYRITADVPQGTSIDNKLAWVKLADEVSNAIVPQELTIETKQNPYTAINPDIFKAIRYGNLIALNFQLGVSSMPTDAANYTQIANMILPKQLFTGYSTLIPSQQGSNYSVLRVLINTDGGIWIMNPEAGKTADGWYRTTMIMVMIN